MNGFSQTLANLLSLQTQLASMQPSASTAVPGSPDFTSLIPALISATGDLQNDAGNMAAATNPLGQLTSAISRLQQPATANLATWQVLVTLTNTAILVASVVAAQNLVDSLNANNCIPTTQALSDFQQAYHANNVGVVVSGVYDNATAAALGTTLGTVPPACATPVKPVDPPAPAPTPTPAPAPTSTPAATAAPNNTALYVVGGVAAIGLGLLGYRMYQSRKPVVR